MRELLSSRELLAVSGKGGTGKSALAATLGRLLADAGRRVLLLEIDPRESIHQLFGQPPSGGEILRLGPRLFLQNLRPRAVLDELIRERLRIGILSRRVLASPVYEHFAEGAPGLENLAVLGHALRLVRGLAAGAPDIELVILDAPATGHGLSLLEAPLLVEEVIRKGPIGKMTAEVAEWVRDPKRSGTVVVTQAEEMPVSEALELGEQLADRIGRRPDLLVVNGLYPPAPPGRGEARSPRPVDILWRRRRALNDRELVRLAKRWRGPRIELPLLPLDRGPELVESLALHLDRAFERLDGRS